MRGYSINKVYWDGVFYTGDVYQVRRHGKVVKEFQWSGLFGARLYVVAHGGGWPKVGA